MKMMTKETVWQVRLQNLVIFRAVEKGADLNKGNKNAHIHFAAKGSILLKKSIHLSINRDDMQRTYGSKAVKFVGRW